MIASAFSTIPVSHSAAPANQANVEQGEPSSDQGSNTANFENESAAATQIHALAESGQYSDVLELASHILGESSEYGDETRELLVEPLMKHATVRKNAGESLQAKRAAELAIGLIERSGGVFERH